MMEFMTGFVDKKKDICMFFMGRVTEEIASDYRCIVPSDMYLQLIIDPVEQLLQMSVTTFQRLGFDHI